MRRRMEHFRRSEQKVARFVLRNPEEVIHMRIVDLATEAKVSEPTVVRFCRALGCNGFQDFKLKLAQMLASGSQFAQFSMNDDDSVAEFSQSIFDSTVGTLLSVRDRLDNDAMSRAIQALALANRVEFYGFGASAPWRLMPSTSSFACRSPRLPMLIRTCRTCRQSPSRRVMWWWRSRRLDAPGRWWPACVWRGKLELR